MQDCDHASRPEDLFSTEFGGQPSQERTPIVYGLLENGTAMQMLGLLTEGSNDPPAFCQMQNCTDMSIKRGIGLRNDAAIHKESPALLYLRLLQPMFENPLCAHLTQVSKSGHGQPTYEYPLLISWALSHIRPQVQLVPKTLRVHWVCTIV